MHSIQSLAIEAVAYDDGAQLLRAKYRGSDETVIYENVPQEVYDSLIFADSIGGKLPVTVKLTRKPAGDNFEFKGQISIGPMVTEVASSDNSDISEKEFQDNQTTDDGINPAPKDLARAASTVFMRRPVNQRGVCHRCRPSAGQPDPRDAA